MSFNGMMLTGYRVNQVFITIDEVNPVFSWDLITEAFGGIAPTTPTTVEITVTSQTNIVASSTANHCMDLTGLPNGSSILLINNGEIIAAGGNGGKGKDRELEEEQQCVDFPVSNAGIGAGGGNAILYDGDFNLTIDNENGLIFGGGGGGGGGSSCWNSNSCTGNGGGGGGGGAGGVPTGGKAGGAGQQGESRTFGDLNALNPGTPAAQPGGQAPSGGGGSGGAPGGNGSCTARAGGAGGGFGEPGTQPFGAATPGTAGLAVNNDGSGTTVFSTGGVDGVDVKGVVE